MSFIKVNKTIPIKTEEIIQGIIELKDYEESNIIITVSESMNDGELIRTIARLSNHLRLRRGD